MWVQPWGILSSSLSVVQGSYSFINGANSPLYHRSGLPYKEKVHLFTPAPALLIWAGNFDRWRHVLSSTVILVKGWAEVIRQRAHTVRRDSFMSLSSKNLSFSSLTLLPLDMSHKVCHQSKFLLQTRRCSYLTRVFIATGGYFHLLL